MRWTCQQLPISKITVWINAFIPKNIPGQTKTLEDGTGRTFVPGPPGSFDGGFLTDQRTHSSDLDASSRVQLIAVLDFSGLNPQMRILKRGNPTIEVSESDGKIICKETDKAWRQDQVFSELKLHAPVLEFSFSVSAKNPCSTAAKVTKAAIDMIGTVKIDLRDQTLGFSGKVDQMPAYEMYVQVDNGPVVTVFQKGPTTESWQFGPFSLHKGFESLIGPPDRNIQTQVKLMIPTSGFGQALEKCFPAELGAHGKKLKQWPHPYSGQPEIRVQ